MAPSRGARPELYASSTSGLFSSALFLATQTELLLLALYRAAATAFNRLMSQGVGFLAEPTFHLH